MGAPEAREIRRGRWEGVWPTQATEPAEFPSCFPPCPVQAAWVLGAQEGGRGENRRGKREGPSWRSGRGEESDCPAHSGPGSLLSSQGDPLPSKPPPGCVGLSVHRREAGEIRRGRREGPSQTPDRSGERGGHLPRPLEPRKPAGLPG